MVTYIVDNMVTKKDLAETKEELLGEIGTLAISTAKGFGKSKEDLVDVEERLMRKLDGQLQKVCP